MLEYNLFDNCFKVIIVVILLVKCICFGCADDPLAGSANQEIKTKAPNIILILTDDQDTELHGMFPMENVKRLIGNAGITFQNAFTTSPLCCPSRASVLSGQYAHNHQTKNNSINGGCNSYHWRSKVEPYALPVILQNAGYETFFAGKYLNQYKGDKVPAGWNDFHGLHGNSRYYNFTLRENEKNTTYSNTYLTDLLRNLTIKFLEERAHQTKPFFAMIAPPAPHQPFTPADRHVNAFANVQALRTPNFNIQSNNLDKHWLVAASEKMSIDTTKLIDQYFQKRWESLLAVDELVEACIKHLNGTNELQNTYIVYTSDNGYHLGQFALPFDKRQPYETDIRVPLLIRGPKIPKNRIVPGPVALIDLFPTFLEWAQVSNAPKKLDGLSLVPHLKEPKTIADELPQRRSVLIEYWGEGNLETFNTECPYQRTDRLAGCSSDVDCHCQDSWNNTYSCIRHFHDSIDRIYCEFRDNENFVEAYDLIDDPYQITNLGYELLPIERALYHLALNNLTQCSGSACQDVYI